MIYYYLIINVLAFLLYGMDKGNAKRNTWRIRERTLILIAFLGGGIGAYLGMMVFHHKTKHTRFRILVPLAIILHIILIFYLISFPPFGGFFRIRI